jgi:hypothetical protein
MHLLDIPSWDYMVTNPWSSFFYFLIMGIRVAFLVYIVYFCFAVYNRKFKTVELDQFWELFPDYGFSSEEVYSSIKKAVLERHIDSVLFETVHFSDFNFTRRREYLKIRRGEYYFLIYAAPFGIGKFLSWYYLEDLNMFRMMLATLPGPIGKYFRRPPHKTFYERDTLGMFKLSVKQCINEVIDTINKAQGQRSLADAAMEELN